MHMVSERPTIDVRWETAIGMLLDGLGKTRIAASLDPPIHRNTVTNWTRDPRFRRMLQERLDERDAEVRLRRAHTMRPTTRDPRARRATLEVMIRSKIVVLMGLGVMGAGCGEDGNVRTLPDAAVVDIDAAIDAPPALPDATVPVTAFSSDLEAALPPQINPGTGQLEPSSGFAPLGPAGNQFGPTFLRSATGNTVTLTVTLPAHTKISIGFLFAAIDSLDGTGTFPAGDYLRIDLDGTAIFRESFANATDAQVQSYTPSSGAELARKVDLGFGGPGGFYRDSAYDMSVEPVFQDIPHTASTAVIAFTLEGEGVQTLDDESWGVDNLRVTAIP